MDLQRMILGGVLGCWLGAGGGAGLAAADFGYLLHSDPECAVWWAEGTYKIKPSTPLPSASSEAVEIYSASNEYEPFQLVLRPGQRLDRVEVRLSDLVGPGGRIEADRVSLSRVAYVHVSVPTDEEGAVGAWPDPLPAYEGPFSAFPGENQTLWVTLFVPPGTPAGTYEGVITVRSPGWERKVPLKAHVWDFSLPKETHLRSAFGLYDQELIRSYHNLDTREELEAVYDLYMENFARHRVVPSSPMSLYPMEVEIEGVQWVGGEFVDEPVHSGKRAFRVSNQQEGDWGYGSRQKINTGARLQVPLEVEPDRPYSLSWWIQAPEPRKYGVLVEALSLNGAVLRGQSFLKLYEAPSDWEEQTFEIERFLPEVARVNLHFFVSIAENAAFPEAEVFLDDVRFGPSGRGQELLEAGGFETPVEEMSVRVDFSEFDRGARKYLDELGFNAFNLQLEGLGGGTFYSRRQGVFGGFRQGTPEYRKLLSSYLAQVEAHLDVNGWLGKEYIYWFDEPDEKDYAFVREGMTIIRDAAPRLQRFITEHRPGPDIMDVTEIGCTIFHRVNSETVAELSKQGREYWSYLCTGPKAPWVTLFIDHPAVNLRIWSWMSYAFQLKGLLVWSSNYWTSNAVFPPDQLQNPWEDPMSYRQDYGTPFGEVNYWGNGDGRFLYPPNRNVNEDRRKYLTGPVNSIRWELLREGIEDYEHFRLLEQALEGARESGAGHWIERGRELLTIPETIFVDGKTYTKDPQPLYRHRAATAEVLEALLGGS